MLARIKKCSRCGKSRELCEFSRDSRTKDGLRYSCVYCIKQYNIAYRIAHLEKEKARILKWQKENAPKKNAINTKYQATKIMATPSWLTDDDFKSIEKFYIDAQKLSQKSGVQHDVDHIIPLKNKKVCGLHVPWNLQVLTSQENNRKHNSL